jgi:hypothetical protein
VKLVELDPRWLALESGGPRVGLSFECPHCRDQRIAVLFHHSGVGAFAEDQYIMAHGGAGKHVWEMSGTDFTNISLSPSVDASAHGHWHGYVRNGEVT